jgi:hypothetical protein
MSKEMRKYIDTFKNKMLNENEETYILVNNSKALDVPMIRPLINGVKLKLKKTIEGETMFSRKIYVVDYEGDEVYLDRDEVKFIK